GSPVEASLLGGWRASGRGQEEKDEECLGNAHASTAHLNTKREAVAASVT
ncbi:MAG: hypothetical protein H6Q78_994, partial [Candidatus Krumholzibacteriota bacterium]|nr:hypothetical protein [Candidatus Krumholzibacteriota bacterium]